MQAPSRCGRRAAARRSMAAAVVVLSLAGCQATGVKPDEDAAQALATATLSRAMFDEETRSWGVEPTNSYRPKKFHAPTPNTIAGATVVTTGELLERMQGASPPVLVDVLNGKSHRTLPGALWLKGAGRGSGVDDDLQEKLAAALEEATGGDKGRTVVFFCQSAQCWLSHNASLRALALGYGDVVWYRGGVKAWEAAGLPMVRSRSGW